MNADRRVRRTQKLLHRALISLVLERNYDSITIQEILDRADIGRSTFYAHFSCDARTDESRERPAGLEAFSSTSLIVSSCSISSTS